MPINDPHPMALHTRILKFAGKEKLQKNLEGASLFRNAAVDALEAIPKVDQKGAKPDRAFHKFILSISNIYAERMDINLGDLTVPYNGHNERYYGEYFEFVDACVMPLDPIQGRSNQALGELFRRVLGLRK